MAMANVPIDSIRSEHDLEVFIRDHVETNDAYRTVFKGVIKNVSDILKNNVKGKYRPDEVLKTGSIAKGTAVKGKSDVDLVFLLSRREYPSIDHLHAELKTILDNIKDALSMIPQFRNVRVQPRAVSFQTDCREPGTGHAHVIDVDILPAVNFGDADIRSIHSKMRETTKDKRNLYTPSLTKWQRDFIKKDRTEQLKKLIRFVKYWKNVCVERSPSSFGLELLIIFLWEKDHKPQQFKLTNALRKVMETIADTKNIRVEFLEYYNQEFQQRKVHFLFAYIVLYCGIMVMTWHYRSKHPAEFPFLCKICKHEERRFKREEDQQKHDEMTKCHDPDYVPVRRKQTRRKRKRKKKKSKVNKIIDLKVLPDENFRQECKAVLKRIGNILKKNVSQKYRPAEVIKAGSTGKGTAIKGNSDVDIVFFLPESNFNTVKSMISEHTDILNEVEETLTSSKYIVTGRTAKALQLRVKCHENGSGKSHYIDVDVLPAASFGILGTKFEKDELQEIYEKMKTGPVLERKFYTPSLTKQQKMFVKRDRPETLKRLIRFVKYWKNTSIQVKNPPSSYSFELLLIDLWQQDNEPDSFTIENGLRRVMEQLVDYKSIKVEFFVFYYESMKQKHKEPYIIDPVNPYSNVLDVTHSDWHAVERYARKFLERTDMKKATSGFCS